MIILETERLILREVTVEDAAFILELFNEPSWLHFIGDRGIKTMEAARDYVENVFREKYARSGFGSWLVELRGSSLRVGLCGLIKRDGLEDVDLGFAFLATHQRKGYATEAASATITFAKTRLGLNRVVAITSPSNESSRRLLEKLGFRFERMARLSDQAPEVKLYGAELVDGVTPRAT